MNIRKFGNPKTNTPGVIPNVIKLRKAGSHKDVGSSFFVTILEIMLDK